MLSAYYHIDDDTLINPYPNSGATVPAPNIGAFTATDMTRAQVLVLSDTKAFGSTAVNEFRFSYVRNAAHLFTPSGGLTQNGQPITLDFTGLHGTERAPAITSTAASRRSPSIRRRAKYCIRRGPLGHNNRSAGRYPQAVQQHISMAGQFFKSDRDAQHQVRRPIPL